MFKRNIEKELLRWSNDKYRKPLILRGARQVGKTTVVNQFSENFENFLTVNLEKNTAVQLFESTDEVKDLLPLIFLYCNVQKKPGITLLFIDEIQNSPHTVSLLRYFYEELPEIRVIAAGSLLETLLDKTISLPVGRVQYLAMRPCSFTEFLHAADEGKYLEILNKGNLSNTFHVQLSGLFNTYSLIGGMPEIVARYVSDRDIKALDRTYSDLLNGYKNDAEKYAENKTQAQILRYILSEGWAFAGQIIKLGGFAGSTYKSREAGEALRILNKAMLNELVYPSTNLAPPVITDLKKSPKLFWLDCGLINYSAGIQKEFLYSKDLNSIWRGMAAEQMVYQELKNLNFEIETRQNYWVRNQRGSTAEVDFVFPFENLLIPVEVKSGNNAHLKSLHQFMNESPHDIAVRIWSGKFSMDPVKTNAGKSFRLINLPFYMISALPEILNELL